MAETLTVNLQERSYPIVLGAGLQREVGAAVELRRQAGGRVVGARPIRVILTMELFWRQSCALLFTNRS